MRILLLMLFCVPQLLLAQELVRPAPAVKLPPPKERCVAAPPLSAEQTEYPGEENIQNTTNLRRPTGIAVVAAGDRIYFTGQIVDSDCVPVPEALIEIWQVDSVGNRVSRDPNFSGSGRMYTDNEGNFAFLTIFPGNYAKRAPHINFRITHEDFPKEVFGAVFFDLHPANERDPAYKAYSRAGKPIVAEQRTPTEKQRLTDRNFHTKIILKGRSAFRRF